MAKRTLEIVEVTTDGFIKTQDPITKEFVYVDAARIKAKVFVSLKPGNKLTVDDETDEVIVGD